MNLELQGRVPELTAILSVLALALVFGVVLGAVPPELLPRFDPAVELIPHLNAVISLAAIGSIAAGVVWIRRGDVPRHRIAMLASTLLFTTFLVLYLYRVTLEGPTAFPGPATVEQYVYYPVLAIHVLFAVICIPFVVAALLFAALYPTRELPATPHPRVGRIAAALWLVSFALGVVVYLLLYVVY